MFHWSIARKHRECRNENRPIEQWTALFRILHCFQCRMLQCSKKARPGLFWWRRGGSVKNRCVPFRSAYRENDYSGELAWHQPSHSEPKVQTGTSAEICMRLDRLFRSGFRRFACQRITGSAGVRDKWQANVDLTVTLRTGRQFKQPLDLTNHKG